jgi:hypothetical protein
MTKSNPIRLDKFRERLQNKTSEKSMDVSIPGVFEAAIPGSRGDIKNKRVAIISDNMSGPNHNDPNFLSDEYPKTPPKLYITSEEDEFDAITLNDWKAEGFNVEYLSMGNGGKEYQAKLDGLRQTGLGPCETFGIVGKSRK